MGSAPTTGSTGGAPPAPPRERQPVPVKAIPRPALPSAASVERDGKPPPGPPTRTVEKRGSMKRPLEVTIVGWWVTLTSLFVLLTGMVGSLEFDAGMAASPLPMPLSYVFLFGCALLQTACGIGILYGEKLARMGYCAWGILGLIVVASRVRSPEPLVLSMTVFGLSVVMLFTLRSNRYFSSGRFPVEPSAGDPSPAKLYVQVVGRDCASCAQRISDATTASPCVGCSRPLHLACAAADRHLCLACSTGLSNGPAPDERRR